MTSVPLAELSSHLNADEIRLAVDATNNASTTQPVEELGRETSEDTPPDEYSESLDDKSEWNHRFAAIWAQHEESAIAQYYASRNGDTSKNNQGSINTRTRPVETKYGSDGNQFNPYAPHTWPEYVTQEIKAGRMNPETMDVPRPESNPTQTPVPGSDTDPMARVLTDRHVSWTSSDLRLIRGQGLHNHTRQSDLSSPQDASRFQTSDADSMTNNSLSEENYADLCPVPLLPIDIKESQTISNSPPITAPAPDMYQQESPFDFQAPLYPQLDGPRTNATATTGGPRQLHSVSTGRQRKRLAKPSLVVKLKTPRLKSKSALSSSSRISRTAASSSSDSCSSSSSDSSSATQVTPDSRPVNLKSLTLTVPSLSSARPRAGREARKAEIIRSSRRKRRRDDASPQDAYTETATPTTSQPQGHSLRASTGASVRQPSAIFQAEASAFRPALVPTGARTPEDMAAMETLRLSLARQLDRQTSYIPPPPRPSPYLPPLRYSRTPHLFFTSEILPRNFGPRKRRKILNIFRREASYIPACISMAPGMPSMQYHISIDKPLNQDEPPYHAPLGPYGLGWPKDSLPLEVFHNIADHLSREDLLAMRMVSSEFERKISNIVFHAVVVPFRPEIYGMMIHDSPAPDTQTDTKGKRKAKDLYGPVEQEKTFHDGMKVFQAWGPHIKKFAMAFDVEEDQLTKPPVKGKFEFFSEFWGKYKWPHPYYSRFDFCAGLEKKADEFRCMSAALSNLQDVRELGVSIDSGLGYLCGPDISDRAQLFQEKPKIFGVSDTQKSLKLHERQCLWNGILRSLGPAAATNYVIQGDSILANQTPLIPNEWGFFEVDYHIPSAPHPQPWGVGLQNRGPRIEFVDATRGRSEDRPLIFQGINLANTPQNLGATEASAMGDVNTQDHASFQGREKSPFHTAALVPNNLTPAQKEWLLETEWAQRAFLSSYCMALTDNSHTFQHVHSFTVAKLSSRYLSALQREDFWGALPNLTTLTINVSADWRNIIKADSGVVEAPDIRPSGAATQFHKLLKTCIAVVPGIRILSLGYYGGGEQQVGIFGRNRHILPAPLNDFSDHVAAMSINVDILVLPFVEHLTLTNCWITPPALKNLVARMRAAKLRTLTLDTVSLTAHSGVGDNPEPDPIENGVLRVPDGPPRRFGDPALGDLFEQRGNAPDPRSDGFGWMVESCRTGSWGDVIDKITPGPTFQLLRYAYQHLHDAPNLRDPGPLERINFVSCGYVKLVNMKDFNQSFLGEISTNPPQCLRKRAVDLMPIVMHRNDDPLLGQIIPTLQSHEREVFLTAFPMEMNRDDETKWENHEDGQPVGGSGRFSGNVKKLIFPNEI